MTAAAHTLPSGRYAAGVAAGRWQDDPAQRAALQELDRIARELRAGTARAGGWRRWFGGGAPTPVRGLYLWGGVGRGKTLLEDLLVESVAGVPHQRWHFHRFMAATHERLRALPAGTADTVAVVADAWADELRLLVLDEFLVADIADAMILGRLLERLFARGVTLATTSNTAPENLYRDGLQRARFLPAIALLQRHCAVHELVSSTDYRLRQLTRAATYVSPLGSAAEAAMAAHWQRLSADVPSEPGPLLLNGRPVPVRGLAEGLVWFDFGPICEGPRAAADYIELATDFHTVLVSGVPLFDGRNDNAARRFVHLVDELYDRGVNLLLSAAAEPEWLYTDGKLVQEFERTASRLIEMRSHDYLAGGHVRKPGSEYFSAPDHDAGEGASGGNVA
ncbi:hypothetical protein P873_13895 [Arenimonas composti TR7-09 = DSM 18010]|uniref:Cell division protein ZapE n=1 Tax=Arenimonas composti TR7-09 = DSM 18010 TaxID=1121013 RepID=A0A091BWM3_9GAMM|nr:hypothetical protein P873_13895 [Arenimonas composti TR7-09 = DSM 18010]